MRNPLRSVAALAALLVLALAAPALAGKPLPPETIPLWPGQPPGTEDWSGAETVNTLRLPGAEPIRMVGNVTTPTLTIFRPSPKAANGTAMVVIPGGGFQMLAVDHEGEMVARWLAARGVTAVMLKYRVRMIPGFRMPNVSLRQHPERFAEFAATFEPGRPIAVADAIQAMRVLRADPARFGIDPQRIGMMGFSAGAITTMGVILNAAPAERPQFAAPIYGAMEAKDPPKDAPPLFIAVTQDDAAVPAAESLAIYRRWTDAGLAADLHVYAKGGHGFGMMAKGTTVDEWTGDLEAWLRAGGWLGKKKASK